MTRGFVVVASLLFLLFSGLPYTPVASARAPVSPSADPFAIPRGLEPAVKFWKAIFLDYDSTQLVFFDPKNMSKIHRVVQVKKGASTRRLVRSVRARLVRRGIPSHRIKVQRGISERFAAGVRRSGRYMEHMRKIFSARGLPVELAYLPLVESSFRNDARSFRGAVGMWQFMPGTGRRYMRVTRLVDERRDPMEATRAAARLLQENYRELRTWPLAVTAYNHGRAGMKRAVRQVGTRDIVTIIRRYRSRTFKFASKNFYAEFLAAVHVMRGLDRHLPHVRFDQLVHLDEISLTRRVAVSSLLRHGRVSRAELLKWNPALSRRAFAPVTRPANVGFATSMPSRCAAGSSIASTRSSARWPIERVSHENGCGATASPPARCTAATDSSSGRSVGSGSSTQSGWPERVVSSMPGTNSKR